MNAVVEAFRTAVEPEVMFEVLEEISKLSADERDFEGHTITTARVLSERDIPLEERSVLGLAISFRLQALAQLASDGGGRGWKKPGNEGTEYIHEELVRCACLEPLIEHEGQPSFNPKSFHDRLLAMAEVAGST